MPTLLAWGRVGICWLLEHCFHLVVYILCGEAELLVKHFVGSRVAEVVEAEYLTIGTYKALQVDGQTCGETEYLGTCGDYALLVLFALAAEESLRRNAHDAYLHAILAEQLGAIHEC